MKLRRKEVPRHPLYHKKHWQRFQKHASGCVGCSANGLHLCEKGRRLFKGPKPIILVWVKVGKKWKLRRRTK